MLVVGGSRIAYYLTRQLLDMGMDVTVVERDHKRCLELCEYFPKAIVIEGDGSDHELLMEEGLDKADAFVALTGNDEENILLSLFASASQVSKTITKVNRTALLKIAQQLPLDSVVSPKAVVTNQILQYARALDNSKGSNVETLYRMVGDRWRPWSSSLPKALTSIRCLCATCPSERICSSPASSARARSSSPAGATPLRSATAWWSSPQSPS